MVVNLVKKTLVLVTKDPKDYMVEKTYNLAPYKVPFEPIECLSDPYRVQNMFPHTKIIVGTLRSTHIIFNVVKKTLVLVKNDPQ